VNAERFWHQVQGLLVGAGNSVIKEVYTTYQRNWKEILRVSPEQKRVALSSAALRTTVEAAFPASGPAWSAARYHSPDLMIAAPNVDAVAEGNCLFVLGEIHIGVNTLNSWVFMAQHPAFDEVGQWIDRDIPEPRVAPVAPRHWPTLTTRTQVAYISPKDYRLASAAHCATAGVARERLLRLGELTIERTAEGLVARTHTGQTHIDIVELFADILSFMVNDGFHILPLASHTPRVSVDDLVVCRETWRFDADALQFANEKNPEARFLAARRWCQSEGLPRLVFGRVPVEKKPFYVDLESSTYINLFAKFIRRTQSSQIPDCYVTVSEMLPTMQEVWLPDAQGRSYSSELRVVAVDQKPVNRSPIRGESAS
jgi:hypothetical protein